MWQYLSSCGRMDAEKHQIQQLSVMLRNLQATNGRHEHQLPALNVCMMLLKVFLSKLPIL